jgi:hypothetical protein
MKRGHDALCARDDTRATTRGRRLALRRSN